MILKKYQPLCEVLVASVVFYILHKLLFLYTGFVSAKENFHYSLEFIYTFFASCSLLIIFILIKVKEKNLDLVGNTFMGLTCFKMLISYIILRPVLNSVPEIAKIEKMNFFIVFALFLAIETVTAIRLLNKKQ